jgi:hypothetical protein
MAQNQKLLKRLISGPKDFTWNELTSVLSHFGYKEMKTGKTGGSRRRFVGEDNHILLFHKPHPGNILKRLPGKTSGSFS